MSPGNASAPRVLWTTWRGAPVRVAAYWLGWSGAATLGAASLASVVGPAGAGVGILTLGWLLARRSASPLDCLRRFHLDDAEVLALGPFRRIRRITWAQVERITQERHALVLAGCGRTLALPLPPLLASAAWGPVLARVVPTLADDLWERLEAGMVRLVPPADPPLSNLLWWSWVPTLLACLALGSPGATVAVCVLAAGERLAAWLVGRARACTIAPSGIDLRGRRGRVFVPWSDALVTPAADGLGVSAPGHDPGFLPTAAPSFWAAAAVIELRAQLGPNTAADVHFRVRFENGGIAVVGEVESLQ